MTFGELILTLSSLPSGNTLIDHLRSVQITPAEVTPVVNIIEQKEVIRGGEDMAKIRTQALIKKASVPEINNALRRVATASDRQVTEINSLNSKIGKLQKLVDSLAKQSGQVK